MYQFIYISRATKISDMQLVYDLYKVQIFVFEKSLVVIKFLPMGGI